MKFADFWRGFVRIPDASGALVCPVPHREQRRFIDAIDARHADGSRLYKTLCVSWAKKTAKSSTAGAAALWAAVASDVPGERLVAIAAWDEEQARIMFRLAAKFAQRHPWLAERVRELRTELVFTETERDPRTGGEYTLDHRVRALARDAKGTHGEPFTAIFRDEAWAEPNADMSEALIIDPTRAAHGFVVYTSYAAPSVMMRRGLPWYDALERAKAHEPGVFYSFVGGRADDASWRVAPWVTEAWVTEQERAFASCPSKFRRVVLNEAGGADGDGLLTIQEIRDAIDPTYTEPARSEPGRRWVISADLGLTNDHTAITVVGLDAEGRVEVPVARLWRGTPDAPVDLDAVEREIRELTSRFPPREIVVDQWQAAQMVQRLQRDRLPARTVGVEAARLDRIISLLKTTFAKRAIRLPSDVPWLLEQLESVKTVEGRSARRDLIKFAPSGSGPDAGSHDDGVVSLGIGIEAWGADVVGVLRVADIRRCNLEASGRQRVSCYLWDGVSLPAGEASCRSCPAHVSVLEAMKRHAARTGQVMDPREFLPRMRPCAFTAARKARPFVEQMFGW